MQTDENWAIEQWLIIWKNQNLEFDDTLTPHKINLIKSTRLYRDLLFLKAINPNVLGMTFKQS